MRGDRDGAARADPRLTAWHGEAGYVYSGIRMRPWPWNRRSSRSRRWPRRAPAAFNSVLLNLYRDGRDSVSWQADDEPGLGRNPVIASISLGAIRRFQVRHRGWTIAWRSSCHTAPAWSWPGRTQHHWLDQVPKTARPVGPGSI